MAGLRLDCPQCGKPMRIRSSTRPSAVVTIAHVYCDDCEMKGIVRAGFEQAQIAQFSPVAQTHRWAQDGKVPRLKKK